MSKEPLLDKKALNYKNSSAKGYKRNSVKIIKSGSAISGNVRQAGSFVINEKQQDMSKTPRDLPDRLNGGTNDLSFNEEAIINQGDNSEGRYSSDDGRLTSNSNSRLRESNIQQQE